MNQETKVFFQFEIIINVLVSSFCFIKNIMGLRQLLLFLPSLSVRTERVNFTCLMLRQLMHHCLLGHVIMVIVGGSV